MNRLEELVEETLAAHEGDAPPWESLLRAVRVRTARRRHTAWGVGLEAEPVGAVVIAVAVAGVGGRTAEHAATGSRAADAYPLPSDGWRPGDMVKMALASGPLHAARRDGAVCAWVGEAFQPMLWPDGYRVRLHPVELIAPDGRVVARGGDDLSAGGGVWTATPGTPCTVSGEAFNVEGVPHLSTGTVVGKLVAVGGPASATARPLSGEVIVNGGHVRRTVRVGADGTFSLTLPPGQYAVTGRSLLYNDGRAVCSTSGGDVIVDANHTVTVDVSCQKS